MPKVVLKLAAIYNILWGAWVVLFPMHFFDIFGLEQPVYPTIWQAVGMIVGVYGIGYWVAGDDHHRHWPIILVGFLGKVFGPIGFLQNWLAGTIPPEFFYMNITNDLIWLPFFTLILWQVWKGRKAANISTKSARSMAG